MTSVSDRSRGRVARSARRRPRARTGRSGAIALCVVALLASGTAGAGERELHAPYLRFDGEAGATLHVSDEGDRGALVRVQLVDRDGRRASYGDHPITISRAVPPGETIHIELSSFRDDGHEGSLTLTASRPVRARVDLGSGGYALVSRRDGKILLPLGGAVPADLSLALVACGDTSLDAMLTRRRGEQVTESARLRVPAGGCRLVPLDDVRAGDVLAFEPGTAVAVVLLGGRDGRALRELPAR